MTAKDIQPPRRHTDLDDDIADAEQKLKDIMLWRRLIWLAIFAVAFIEVCLITVAVAIHNGEGNWYNAASAIGFFGGIGIAAAVIALFVDDSHFGRIKFIEVKANLQRLRIQRRERAIGRVKTKSALYALYKESMPDLVEHFRIVANHNRRIYDLLQAFIIIGALSASTFAGAFGSLRWARWVTVALTLAVGVSSAIGSHFKLNERSTEMQKTADLIEVEFRAVEFSIGEYSDLTPDDALRRFVEKVEQIRTENMTRKRQLDQPSDIRFIDASSVNK